MYASFTLSELASDYHRLTRSEASGCSMSLISGSGAFPDACWGAGFESRNFCAIHDSMCSAFQSYFTSYPSFWTPKKDHTCYTDLSAMRLSKVPGSQALNSNEGKCVLLWVMQQSILYTASCSSAPSKTVHAWCKSRFCLFSSWIIFFPTTLKVRVRVSCYMWRHAIYRRWEVEGETKV